MTLKEKFEEVNILDYRFRKRDLDSKTFYVDAEKCEKIADEFAIGFAEWCENNYFKMGRLSFWYESEDWDNHKKFTTKELLEIYKNESNIRI